MASSKQPALMDQQRGRFFYPVGGTWRNLAQVAHGADRLSADMIHYYTMARRLRARSQAWWRGL